MDYFSRFLKKDGAASLASTSIASSPVKVILPTLPVEVSTPSEVRELQTEIITATTPAEEIKPHPNELKKEDIRLWDTKILKTVLPKKLVWAPLYRFGNQMFCARLVESDEIDRDLYIRTPLEEGETVVEFIRAPKTKACDTRLLVVLEKNIRPFNERDESHSEWSKHYLNKMRKVLNERWNKTDTEFVYNEIVCSAQKYLKEALLFDKELSASIMRQRSPQYKPSKIVFEVVDEEAVELFGNVGTCSNTSSSASTSSKANPESLAVGDFVAYFSELNNNVVVFARIEGFSGEAEVPLVLSNGGDVHITKRLRKLEAVPAEVNALGYEPLSGHYRTLSEYSWEGHDVVQGVVDLTNEIGEDAVSTKKSTPASRKKGTKGKATPTPSEDEVKRKEHSALNKTQNPPESARKATPKRVTRRAVASGSQESEPISTVESTQDSYTSATSLAVTVSPPTSQLSEPNEADQNGASVQRRSRAAQSVSAKSPSLGKRSAEKEAQTATDSEATSEQQVAKRPTRSSR